MDPGPATEAGTDSLRTILTNVSTVFSAAVDDGLIATNPCRARSVKLPQREQRKIQPWPTERAEAVIDALPDRYRATAVVAAGCGLRQGEVFGLRVCDIDFLRQQVHVEQQVKLVRSRLVIDRPKRSKTRVVPLPDSVAFELAEHLRRHPATGGDLVFTSREHKPLNRNYFNHGIWHPALIAAGVEPGRDNGMHALRHFYASVLIDAGESVKAVAEYLGHASPASLSACTPTSSRAATSEHDKQSTPYGHGNAMRDPSRPWPRRTDTVGTWRRLTLRANGGCQPDPSGR